LFVAIISKVHVAEGVKAMPGVFETVCTTDVQEKTPHRVGSVHPLPIRLVAWTDVFAPQLSQ